LARAAYPRTRNELGGVSERVSMQLDTTGLRPDTLGHERVLGVPLDRFLNFKVFRDDCGNSTSAAYMSRLPDTFGRFWTRADYWAVSHI